MEEKIEISDSVMGNITKFKKIVESDIHRNGIGNLMKWLEGTDFYTAPASTRFHLARQGGLLEHSLNVRDRLFKEFRAEYPGRKLTDMDYETLTIISLFHDLCKVNFYKEATRNVKEGDIWVKKPYYTVDEKISLGHGEKSVIIIQQFMRLRMEEIVAINSHMGFSDTRVKGGDYSIINMWDRYPLALLLHVADLKATKLDEKENRQ